MFEHDGTEWENAAADAQDPQRRRLIKGMAAAAGAAAAGAYLPRARAAGTGAAEEFADIRHVIVLMMENRSFDHMLGWVPGADGVQAGRSFANKYGLSFPSYPLPGTQSLAGGDPEHGYAAGRTCYNNGAMDGFLRTETAATGLGGGLQLDLFPISYLRRSQLPFFSGCADYFTIGDRYFTGLMGPTWPNRMYMHAGQTDRLATGALPADHDGLTSDLPTIWDLARAAGVSHKYYYSDIPFTALWGSRFLDISRPLAEFLQDAANGNLPSISFVDPAQLGEVIGLSNDDHPLADVANGQAFMNKVYEALRTSPNWPNTLLVINYDEWGGFADHVPPPLAPVSEAEANLKGGGNDGRLGIRVPLVLIGPRTRRNAVLGAQSAVVKHQYDPNAILNFICDRFGLPGLGIRAATTGSIASALLPQEQADYSAPPAFAVPPGSPIILSAAPQPMTTAAHAASSPAGGMSIEQARAAGMGEHLDDLQRLQRLALTHGFPVYGLRL
mgnify:CR=1 FL=1